MKNFNDLTQEELQVLTDSDVEMYIRLELVEKGIPLQDVVTKKLTERLPDKDVTVFCISGIGRYMVFEDINEATKVADLLKNCKIKTIDTSNNHENLTPFRRIDWLGDSSGSMFDLFSRNVYSEELYNQLKTIIKNNQEAEKFNKNLSEQNEENSNARSTIENEIYQKVETAKSIYRSNLRQLDIFQKEYLPLANNDFELAISFFIKAYGNNSETFIRNNHKSKK